MEYRICFLLKKNDNFNKIPNIKSNLVSPMDLRTPNYMEDNQKLLELILTRANNDEFPLTKIQCANLVLSKDQFKKKYTKGQIQPVNDVNQLTQNYNIDHLDSLLKLVNKIKFRVYDFFSSTTQFNPQIIFICEQHEVDVEKRSQILDLIATSYLSTGDMILTEGHEGTINFATLHDTESGMEFSCIDQSKKYKLCPKRDALYYIINKLASQEKKIVFNDCPQALKEQERVQETLDYYWNLIATEGSKCKEGVKIFDTSYDWCKLMQQRIDKHLQYLLENPAQKKLQTFGMIHYWWLNYLPHCIKERGISYLCIAPEKFDEQPETKFF